MPGTVLASHARYLQFALEPGRTVGSSLRQRCWHRVAYSLVLAQYSSTDQQKTILQDCRLDCHRCPGLQRGLPRPKEPPPKHTSRAAASAGGGTDWHHSGSSHYRKFRRGGEPAISRGVLDAQ